MHDTDPEDARYAELPIEPLVRRWKKLPGDARAYAFGCMTSAVERADAALGVAEEYAADKAAKAAAAEEAMAAKDVASLRKAPGLRQVRAILKDAFGKGSPPPTHTQPAACGPNFPQPHTQKRKPPPWNLTN